MTNQGFEEGGQAMVNEQERAYLDASKPTAIAMRKRGRRIQASDSDNRGDQGGA